MVRKRLCRQRAGALFLGALTMSAALSVTAVQAENHKHVNRVAAKALKQMSAKPARVQLAQATKAKAKAGYASIASVLATTEPTIGPHMTSNLARAIDFYRQIAKNGGWRQVKTGIRLRFKTRNRAVYALRARLKSSGDLAETAPVSDYFDAELKTALQKFQARHGLKPDGVLRPATKRALNVPVDVRVRQLETNLVRIRAQSGYPGDRYVMVNIPAAQIEVVEMGQVVARHAAIVGKIDRQTPLLTSRIHEINFNPYWHVPKSIIRKDLIPKVKEDPLYLEKNRIRIYKNGQEISAQDVNWQTDEATKYLFRQDPGQENAMSSMKINFVNPHSVYLHDTPAKSLFGQDSRFYSAGCVRVAQVRNLATWLLRDTADWTREKIDATIATQEQITAKLKEPVPIYTLYITSWMTSDGIIHFRDDIYNRDGLGALAQN